MNRERDPYTDELQTILGIVHIHAAWGLVPMAWDFPGAEEKAEQVWTKLMAENSRGLSVSDLPRFIYPDIGHGLPLELSRKGSLQYVGGVLQPREVVKGDEWDVVYVEPRLVELSQMNVVDPKQWDRCTADVHAYFTKWIDAIRMSIAKAQKRTALDAKATQRLEQDTADLALLEKLHGAWTYESFLKLRGPLRRIHPLDLENPRIYRVTNGKEVINEHLFGSYMVRVSFWRRLLVIWDDRAANKRADNLRAFLDHHHRTGGHPEAFRDLVAETLPGLRRLKGRGLLVEKVEGWLKGASSAVPKAITTAAKPWPNLKSLALFHAFRCEAGERSADITHENASEIAKDAGYPKPSSGKELKGHFARYAWGTPEEKRRERTRDGRTGDVLTRYAKVISKLALFEKALALAVEERKSVLNRSNASEV